MQKESTVSQHPVSDPLTQAILRNEESREIHRQRSRVALERERATRERCRWISLDSSLSRIAWVRGSDTGCWDTVDSFCMPPLWRPRSEEHTSELQSRGHLVCRLLLEKKNRDRAP